MKSKLLLRLLKYFERPGVVSDQPEPVSHSFEYFDLNAKQGILFCYRCWSETTQRRLREEEDGFRMIFGKYQPRRKVTESGKTERHK